MFIPDWMWCCLPEALPKHRECTKRKKKYRESEGKGLEMEIDSEREKKGRDPLRLFTPPAVAPFTDVI